MSQPLATPAYRAEMRRAFARREARKVCQAAIQAAYEALEQADGEADRIYLADMAEINAGQLAYRRAA